MDVATFREEIQGALRACRENVERFRRGEGCEGFAETLRAFDRMLLPLNARGGHVGLYVHVHPDAEVREACEALEQEMSSLATEISLDRGVYDRLAALEAPADATPGEARLLEKALKRFRRGGVDRDEPTRERLRALQEEIVRVGQDFDRNIIAGGAEYVIPEGHAGLAGLPEDFLASHPERADGSVVLSTDPTDRMPFLSYAERDDLRREYFLKTTNRACPANLEVLPRLLALRHELATLLGYEHWADYVTEDKMTGSADEARRFIERVLALVEDRARAECAELEEAKRARGGEGPLEESERLFLTERVKAQSHGFDSQDVRPYFGFEAVRDGVLATSAKLYGIEFRHDTDREVWHPSVRCYEIVDGGDVLARFYLDMHPREHKYKHAAMFGMVEGIAGGALPEAALICNFPEPTKDDPGLLLHDQVTTFFHEFGHLLHHLFAGRQELLAFSGIATEHDFVEVPSQMYEEWAWDHEVLQTFARHYRTAEAIPEDLVRRMRAAEEYGKGLHVQTQMFYALLSLTYYDRSHEASDLAEVMIDLKGRTLAIAHTPGNNFQASFGHLHGYSAMYYTYMWSLVIAKDLFGRFGGDLMSGATANEYRANVLAQGGARDARELVRGFLGRDYAFEAFETWLAR